jgi:hypothetical protein
MSVLDYITGIALVALLMLIPAASILLVLKYSKTIEKFYCDKGYAHGRTDGYRAGFGKGRIDAYKELKHEYPPECREMSDYHCDDCSICEYCTDYEIDRITYEQWAHEDELRELIED